MTGDWVVTISQQSATTGVSIAAAKQPASAVVARLPMVSMAEPLRLAVGVGQLQLSLWEHERQFISSDDGLVSRDDGDC